MFPLFYSYAIIADHPYIRRIYYILKTYIGIYFIAMNGQKPMANVKKMFMPVKPSVIALIVSVPSKSIFSSPSNPRIYIPPLGANIPYREISQ